MAEKGLFAIVLLGLVGFAQVGERMVAIPAPPDALPTATAPAEMAPDPAAIEHMPGAVTLARATDGHFYVEAQVNAARIRFLVDTGASGLVLTRADALRAGIGAGDYDALAMGAGGPVKLMPATLDRVALGPFATHHVDAYVAEAGLPVSLLGQSYLRRLGSVTMKGDQMILGD